MSDYNENNQGGYDPQSSSQSFGQGTGGAPIPPNSYYHYQGAGPGGVAGTNATAPVNPASPYAQPAGAHNAQAYAAKQGPKPKKNHSGAKTFGIAFAGAALACVLVLGGTGVVNTVTSGSPSGSTTVLGGTSSASTSGNADENATLAESVSQKCLPSVVAIDVYTNQQSGYYGYNTQNSLTETSLGSGVVLSSDGYIVTNYHVIEGADALKVTIEGEEYDADIIGSDPSSDIAVIKAKNASGLTAMELGDSDDLTVGEWVMSIGSPFGLEQSVATGIVSATNRSQIMDNSSDSYQYGQQQSSTTTVYTNMIQTDAAINPGNSGGALVDKDGKLIGINTLITSYSGNYSGVGFAIPANYAVNLAQQIIEGKTPTHAQLGVSLSTINAQTAQRYGFSVDEGAYIAAVSSGSGADSAGLKVGDIVTAFDDKKVSSASDLMLAVRSKNPGDTATVTINRDGQSQDVQVTLGSDESSQASAGASSGSNSSNGNGSNGGSLEDLLRQYGYGGGSSSSGTSADAGSGAIAQAA
ncbi:S1C family serine protease [Ellagibacter isourolithinifaciens]|uniref:S1C family serine protease n=1 Tax=Ellagibacter isourolithinifaciens TaxID=2137581 RepID=UPI003AAB96AF